MSKKKREEVLVSTIQKRIVRRMGKEKLISSF